MARVKLSLPTVVGLVIALGWPFTLLLQRPESLTNVSQDVGIVVKEWMFTLVILAIVIFWERRSLASLGFRLPGRPDFIAMLLIALANFFVSGVAAFLTTHGSSPLVNPKALVAVPLILRVAMTLTAGFCEETLYRGFATERLLELFGNRWVAGLTVVFAFGLAHVARYGFNAALFVPTVTGGMLTLLYLWRRNLPICMLLHSAIDGIALILAPLAAH